MAKKIADGIKKENHFDELVMAVVSQDHDLINVQQQIAEKLGLEIKEKTLDARADRLHTRLMDQGRRIILIIDDLWKEIDLSAIGIPTELERKGLKVLLTSRYLRVCSKMDVKEIIEVGVLINEESWGLFKKHANISDDDSDALEGYPRKVADKCQGLPLAIEVIGKTLKDRKEISEWRDALRQLESAQDRDTWEDMHDKVYSSIAWSINYLETQRKSLLLLCSLFPEDYEIEVEDLVRYTKGLQIFKGIEKMAQTRDRVEKICFELKDCYLLIACDDHRVKLHDVVRDTCLKIASQSEIVYMVSHSWLKEFPDKDTYESYTAISCAFSDLDELPSCLNCSRLQILRLSLRGGKNMDIITRFLQATEKLQVLDINKSKIELLPQSLQTYISLRTLNLHNCSLVGDLSALLESLVKIEVLSFFNSSYKGKWPKEISKLSNLKSLDLRFSDGPRESLPTGILMHLKKLEELYLGRVFNMRLPESKEIIAEIASLSNLNTIEISVFDSHVIVENLDVERLLRFFIGVSYKRSPYQISRAITIHKTNIDILSEPKMKALLSKVGVSFELFKVIGFNNDFDGGSVFSCSKSLEIKDCKMKYICNTANSRTRPGVFVDLKRLYIYWAEHLEELCHGNIPPGSFVKLEQVILEKVPHLSCLWGHIIPPCLGNLTRLKIHDGKMITSLFLGSSVKCFARLRLIEIESCPMLETLVACDVQTDKDAVECKTEFPNLEEVHLEDVCGFKTLCSQPEALPVLLCSTKSDISVFPKLRILMISGSDCLHVADVTKNGQNLSILEMSKCYSLEVCFDFEGWSKEITKEVPETLFHNLDSLTLKFLSNLKTLWRNLPEGAVAFQNLSTLSISFCGSLKHLLTPQMAKMLVNLETLDIHSCGKLEAIVGSEEISASNCHVVKERMAVFQKLTTLTISHCDRLKHLLTLSMAKMLVNLERLDISFCKDLKAIVGLGEGSNPEMTECEGERIFDRLEHLELGVLPNFQRMFPKEIVAFQKLLTLNIRECGGLRCLLTPPMVKMLASLKALKIESCEQMESIIGSEVVDEAATNEVVHVKEELLLPELCDLKLKDLPEFRMLCSQSVDLALPCWSKFVIGHCPRINRFCAGNLIAPELKQVRFLIRSNYDGIDLDLETTMKWFKVPPAISVFTK